MTRTEIAGMKLALCLFSFLLVYGFMFAQADYWREVKAAKADYKMRLERDRALDSIYAPVKPKPLKSAVKTAGLNNAGNLRGADGEFVSFPSKRAGVEAMRADIVAKISGESRMMQARYGSGYKPTLEKVIAVYAPPTENNTAHYINFVAKRAGINPKRKLSIADAKRIIPHMITLEQGSKKAQKYQQYAMQ